MDAGHPRPEERFGARVVSGFGSALTVSVARPPLDAEHAEGLVGRHQWRFWWD
ncbi:DUF4253 domain-containing protein [Streptomyces sp. NBC_01478]|jgi:hypothetical protein|uniref:hypothetical protein n=1 Tax=Streptomyces sp. NBC_01478 TaxID=2903882 RepID=UPI002E319478|nr:hypothetical protein [Streptomyces sp. NBC_01478]